MDQVEVLDAATVDAELAETGLAWRREGNELTRTWSGEDFAEALAFVNAVGVLAEEADHHPDIDIRWNRVVLRLSTHSAGGITRRDLQLASRIDALASPGD